MLHWHWYLADPIVSVIVVALIFFGAWNLLRESVDVLLEGTPGHLDIPEILADLGRIDAVLSIHDFHAWSITSEMPAMSCHVVLRRGDNPSMVLDALIHLMKEKYKIEHTTIQIEFEQIINPR
jgi:cobalt-zinc-cadmium efflux system protein